MKEKLALITFLLILSLSILWFNEDKAVINAGGNAEGIVVTLGENLTESQKRQVLDVFSKFRDLKDVKIITVSNVEERQLLAGVVDESLIGSRAISSAYVEVMEKSNGIEVKTENITSITPFMYANALATAGIEDSRVIVAAPFPVSGTAALAGIMKAFETAKGEKLSPEAKKTAAKEAAETSRLGEKIGKDNAEKLVFEIKKRVLDKNISEPEEIKRIIIEVSGNLNINLSEADIDRITQLMIRLQRLDISINDIGQQLKLLDRNLKDIKGLTGETKSFLQRIIEFLKNIIMSIKEALS
ncbi:DUF1002 domain-containing protein [Thermosyntropha sp.]|uniref:DUF1002 domain-containing protein n=1 Tax=Thermosyntropha sp. TaxID=2740820 RepID=UPI0025FFB7D4|nr:DUF1002 domain-containing protein [Thermosyntropha sp.]MBO8158013.1 DUF1002 domain-containing protein [Thermosyntropha sp.]